MDKNQATQEGGVSLHYHGKAREEASMIRIKVREVAEARGISQNRLSQLAVLDIKVVRKMFREPTASFTTYALNKVAKALQVDVFELIESIPDEP